LAPWQKRKLQSSIEEGLDRALPVEALAKLVSLSPSYFSGVFKTTFGDPPHSYITRRRVEQARTLIMTTSQSLSQIAFACGFVDQAHLGRNFRQVTGMTPGAWRRSATVQSSTQAMGIDDAGGSQRIGPGISTQPVEERGRGIATGPTFGGAIRVGARIR
jgi:AraC-like DNA-binding protein